MDSMDSANTKAVEILGKVIVKLQELVKELEVSPAPTQQSSLFGMKLGGKHHSKGKGKGKKVKGGADMDMTKSAMLYNTNDLMSGVSKTAPNPMNDGNITSLPYLPQPFSAGNTYNFASSIKDVLSDNDALLAIPTITGGAKKSKKAKKSTK